MYVCMYSTCSTRDQTNLVIVKPWQFLFVGYSPIISGVNVFCRALRCLCRRWRLLLWLPLRRLLLLLLLSLLLLGFTAATSSREILEVGSRRLYLWCTPARGGRGRGLLAAELSEGAAATCHHRVLHVDSLQARELALVLHMLGTEIFANGDQVAQALQILGVLLMYVLVQLECLLVIAHAAVATRNHELPFDFVRLHSGGLLEEADCLLVNLVLDEPHAQPRDDVKVDRIEFVGLQMIMKSVGFVLILATDLAQTSRVQKGHECVCAWYQVCGRCV